MLDKKATGGQCYKLAYQYFDKNRHRDPDMLLVHGLIKGQGPLEGKKIDHAWVESEGLVYDFTLPKDYQVLPIEVYYRLARLDVRDLIKYKSAQVYKMASQYGTYGPWDDTLLKHKIFSIKTKLDKRDVEMTRDPKSRLLVLEKYLKNRKYEDYVEILNEMVKDEKFSPLIKEAAGGELANVDLEMSIADIPVTRLMPTQNEIDLDKSLKFGLSVPGNIKNYFNNPVEIKMPLISYNGTYIIDGHHRWSQVFCFNPNAKMTCINFEGDLSPIQMLKSTQLAIAASINKVPTANVRGTSLYKVSEADLRRYVDKNFSDKCVKDLMKVLKNIKSRDEAVDYVVNNAMKLKSNNTPIIGAPKRDFMPQTDAAPESVDRLKKGTVKLSRTFNHRSKYRSF